MAVDSMVRLGPYRLRTHPSEIRWNFQMKTNDAKAMGGKVIQITGLKMHDITVSGAFAPDRAEGDTEAWQQMMRFREWIDIQTESTEQGTKALRFSYPPRGWDFNVFIREVATPFRFSPDEFAPKWTIKLFPIDQTSQQVIKGVRDLYIKRLMNGVGWKQTDYNGPTQMEVDDALGGRTIQEYLADQYEEAAYGSTLDGGGGGGGVGFGGGAVAGGSGGLPYADTPGTITYGGIQP